ncbi:YadA-like family protein, partial [uncultured Mitsuokella sp.]|uniref:YadA-like family protein n=1 Tax=uncultured Mitsuokella sp. TaxID=453120 RepID=UPI00258A6910
DAIAAETTARTTADTELSKKIGALDANGNYLQKNASISSNLSTLDTQIKNVIDAIGLDPDNTTTSYTSKLNKYFKVNPKATTDGTTTYDPDAAANGTNSVAIGPSAQAGEKTTDTTTSTTTVTGGTSSTAIGDRAKANGNQSVALGYGSQVLNTTDQSGKTTATISGSTAIGNGAKVNGATDATAVGTSAQVNETATGGIAFGKNAVTGEDKGTVTVGDVTADVAAVGGENSVALGTSAKASGNTALALGNGAQVNNYTTQSGTTVTKTVNSGSTAIGSGAVVTGANDAVAFGSGAKVEGTGTNADDSLAIGKSASVATAKDAMALGTSASVASGADNAIALGNTARANTTNATAIGYNATATGAGAVAIGENTSTSTEGGISIGSGTSVSGKSIVIGYATDNAGNAVKTESNNTDAVAIGNGAQANANDSISIGHQAGKDTAEGRASGYGSLIAIGTNAGNNVKGMQNVALGSGAGSNVKSSYNVAIGSNAGAGINYAADKDSNPQNGYNVSIGYEANYQSADANAKNIAESIAIGHSANAVSNATAMGYQTTASGDKSMAFGYNATAADTDSIAFGDNASAGGGNIAIGHGSQAPAVTSYSSSYLTNNTTLNGYISLGGKTTATSNDRILRRITNVADGSDDQDAVTVAQLKAAYTNLEGTITTTDTKISDTYTQEAIDTKIKNVESKITASKTKYFSINTSSDTLTANADSDGASTSGAADAMAIGPNASASSSKAVAIGNNVSASGKGSIALGTADNPATTGTVDVGKNTSANPHVTSAEGANSVAIGTSAIAQTDNSVALGTRASVYTSDVTDSTTGTTTKVGQQSIAIGYQAETRNSNAISIGSDAKAYSNGSTAIGHGAYAQGADAIVLGTSSRANGASSGILGKSNTINGSNTYAVGSENKVNGNWGAVTYSGLYGSKNTVNPVADTSGNTKHGMDSLSVTGNSNTISQGSYSDTVQNISILGNGNSVTGANTDEANAGTTANVTIIGGSNEVTGRDGAGSDYMGKTWNQLTRTSIIGYGNKVNQKEAATSLANTQILGNDVTATLGNSVYLGTGSSAKNANSPDTDTLVKAETDAANAVDTTGMTDDQKAKALSDAKAKARYAVKLAAMKANNGSTAGTEALNTDTTYDDGTNYTYAGSSPVGVVTVGSAGKERRIQNVAAGLVSASSTDAVNGSQLYALTRQIRFGGDNSSFGKTTAADDQNVVARGSNETIAITGGSDAVKSSTADGTTTYTVDTAKLTDNNIAVVADTDKNALHVQLASNLKDLNTAQLGSGSGESYKETIKLDGTGTTGGQMTLAGADGTVKTTLDTTGLTIANGPKFTSSGIDAGSQKINHVTAGTDDADAVNVKQLQSARTLLTQGTNTTLADTDADGHHTYTVNVDNLGVKANGTGTTVALANGINFKNGTNTTSAVDSNGNVTIDTKNLTLKANGTNTATVTMDNGINFKNGTNTTATVDTNGTVTISATHNKLDSASYTASNPSDSSNKTTLKLKDTDGNETTLNLTDTYTTVSKNTDHTITFKRNDGSTPVSISLDDLNGASKEALTTAAAKATTQVIAGANVSSVDDTNAGNTDGPHIYKVNVSNLGVKVADGQKKSVALSDGLVFGNGTNTTASVGDNGAITFNVSNDAIKTQAKDAINMKAGTNVNVDTETSKDGLSKTFTISATHNALKSATLTSKSNDVSTLTITDNDGKTASVDIKNTHLTVTKDYEAKTVTFTSNDGTTPATTLSLSDLGAASTADMNAAKAAASTEVKAGTNASLGTVETNQTDQHKIYTVNVDNLGLKQNGTAAGTVTLADGIDFADGTNTSATVSDGKVTFDLKRDVTGIDTVTANNSIQAGNVKVGKQGTDNKNYVTGLDNKNWTVGQTTYEAGRAATEDQLKSVSDKVASGFQVTDGTTSANIGADKKVTFTNGNYTTAKVTQATDGANVQYDINTAQINAGANGTISAPTTDGVATAANVAEAINSAAWNIKANDGTATAIKAGTTVGLKAGNNLTLSQSGTDFTYRLNDELTGIKSLTTVAQDGVTTTLAASGVTIASSGTGNKSVSLTANGLNNGGKQITDVASGGDTDTNAANISDVKRLVQASASGTTETGFNVKGDDATSKKVKLGKQLNVVGGTTDSSSLSDDNIGVVTTADDEGNATLTVKLNKDITLDSVKAGNTTLNTNGVSNGKMNLTGNGMTITDTDPSKQVSVTTNGVSMGSQRIQNVADATQDTDAATLKQVKNARTVVARGSNVSSVTFAEGANNQMTYTVNVDNLSVKANKEAAKSVTLKNGLTFNDGTNTTASVGDNGEVKYDLNSTLTGLTSVTAGNSTLDTNGLTIKDGAATKVEITSGNVTMGGNVIHNVGAGIDPTDAVNKGQLDALQSQVSGGWNLSGTNSDGTAVTAKIGAGKTVTYADGTYTKSVITKDDTTGNATVKVDVTTGTFGSGTDDNAGTVTSTANGLATTQDVANAINSAAINVVADNTPNNKTEVKAGNTIHFAKDDNLTLNQDGTKFTYGLNKEISISKVTTSDATKGSTVQTAEGVTTTDAAGNTYIQNGQGITLTPSDKTKSPVKLTNTGLDNGGNVISGVAEGKQGTDAVNVSQLNKVQDQVGSGWQIAGNDGTKVANIGAGKKVAFKSSSKYLTTSTARSATGESDTGADVTYSLKTTALASGANGTVASIADANDGLVTAQNIATVLNSTYWSAAATASGSGSVSGNSTAASIKAGTQVTFTAGNNLSLTQDGTDFTYALLPDLTSMNTIRFGGTLNNGNWSGGLLIGKQAGSGANTAEGNYITGLSNTKWDRATISENSNMAATEGQLKQAIENITTSGSGTGGFGLQADTGNSIMQDLRKTIQIKGDGEGTQEGNIKTSNEGGTLRIRLNKALDLSKDGSVQVGTSKMSNGTIQLGEDADANKMIRMDSAKGTAAIGGVTVDGANKTVSGLANTTWDADKASQGGYKGSTKAATESQLAEAISTATSTASQDEAHIQSGTYAVGDKSAGATDDHNVSIKVVNGKGDQKGMVTISDVAKASEVGDVGTIAKDIQNKNGDATKPTSIVDAINNLNDKVGDKNYTQVKGKEIADGDSATTAIGKLNNRMNDIYTSSTQHSSVSTMDANLTLSEGKNASGGTDYKLGLNKENIDLGNVTINGNAGSIKADSFTAGDTVVNKDGVKVGDKSALTGDSLKVGGKTYVDDKGIDANGKAIGNVGDGKNDGDAVNVKQVNDLAARQGEAIGQNAAHINQLDRAVNRLDSRINRVGAGAAALAALHPGNYDPDDKVDFAAGFGNYRGASAAAVGMYYHPDETTTMSVGASFGGGENMVNAGITWKMGKDSGHMRTQAAAKAVPVQFVAAPTQT